MTHRKQRRLLGLYGRALALAVATVILASACGTSTTSPDTTIGAVPTGTPSPLATGTPLPSATEKPRASTPAATAAGTASPASATATASAGGTGSLTWTDCGPSFECATLAVPLDYTHPAGRKISIALVRLPAADPAKRIGALVVNPGGPGGSGVEFVESSAEGLFSQELRDHFDIVGFDPRGVGDSTAVECVNGPALDRLNALDPTPETPAERLALIDGAKEFVAACTKNSGDLLPFMSTADAARDMDRLRAALGEARLTYLGFSYGTYLGTVYAALFPTRVRALVLDGAVDPAQSFDQRNEAQAAGFARALNAFLDDCKTRPACAFYNGGKPADAFDALMRRIDSEPLPAVAIADKRPVGAGEAFTGVLAALYAQAAWPALAQGLALAQRGDGSVLLLLADSYNQRQPDGSYKNVAAANNAVNCLDNVVPTDVRAYDAMVPALERVAPRFGAAIAYSGLSCAFWPVHPARDTGAIAAAGAPPILVVGTTGDPATPYQWAVNLAGELESGVLLTRKGEGHTAYGESPCIERHVDRYLISLDVPPPDTTCTP